MSEKDEKDNKKRLNISIGDISGKVVKKTQPTKDKETEDIVKNSKQDEEHHECCGACSSDKKETLTVDFPKNPGEETEICIQIGNKKISLENISQKDLINWVSKVLFLPKEGRNDLAELELDTYQKKKSLFDKTIRKCEQHHKIQLKMSNKERTGFPII